MTGFLNRVDAGSLPEILVLLAAAVLVVGILGLVLFLRDRRRAARELERRRARRHFLPDPIETNADRHWRSLGRRL